MSELSSGCTHHWILPTPNGRQSVGVCKLCLDSRLFHNSFPDDYSGLDLERHRGMGISIMPRPTAITDRRETILWR